MIDFRTHTHIAGTLTEVYARVYRKDIDINWIGMATTLMQSMTDMSMTEAQGAMEKCARWERERKQP